MKIRVLGRQLAALSLAMISGTALAASLPAVEEKNGMVVTSQHLASKIGVDILKMGGNAVDAAVAVGYAQAVVNPCCGNIGGGGFMTIHLADGRDVFLNFREKAPAAATADMYLDAGGNVVKDSSLYGYRAVGVPGTVLGLDTALRKYGKLDRSQVMAPAIRLAREGFVLNRGDTDILDTTVERILDERRIAQERVAIHEGMPHGFGHHMHRRRRVEAHSLQVITFERIENLAHRRAARTRRRRGMKYVAAIVAGDRLAFAHRVGSEIGCRQQTAVQLRGRLDRPRNLAFVKDVGPVLGDRR